MEGVIVRVRIWLGAVEGSKTTASAAAGVAVVPCWARVTVHDVFAVPPTAVTWRISEPMLIVKGTTGNLESLATVMAVCAAVMGHARVVLVTSGLLRYACHGETG